MNSLIGVFPLGNELNERNERNDEPVTYATASRIDEGGEIVAASLHRRAGKNPLEANLWGGSVEGDRNERTITLDRPNGCLSPCESKERHPYLWERETTNPSHRISLRGVPQVVLDRSRRVYQIAVGAEQSPECHQVLVERKVVGALEPDFPDVT